MDCANFIAMKAVVAFGLLLVTACDGDHVEGARPAASPQKTTAHETRRETPPPPAPKSHAAESCGELAMTRAGLTEEGKGEKHPEVVGVDALLAQCTDKTPSPEECRRVSNELTESTARGYGSAHPKVRSLRAKQTLCSK